jgi:hypothetical protein
MRAIKWIHAPYMRVQDQKVETKAKPTWHHFGWKINWFKPKKQGLKGELMV